MENESKKSIAERLRAFGGQTDVVSMVSTIEMACDALSIPRPRPGSNAFGYGDAVKRFVLAIADEIEREQRVIIEAQQSHGFYSAHRIMQTYAEYQGRPMLKGETITAWLARYYMQLPCYPDGEPVSKGCEVRGGIVDGWCVWDDGGWTLNDDDGNNIGEGEPRSCIERPEPPVLDADGVPIKVGDIVYENGRPNALRVIRLFKYGDIEAHGDRGVISKLDSSNYSHREPDSLEKLRDDMKKYVAEGQYHGSIDAMLDSWADRLTALMERGA